MADIYGVQARLGVSSTPSIASDTTALAANSQRGSFLIQNLGTNALFVRFGAGASATLFNVVLKAGSGTDDGSGGSIAMEGAAMYTGIITVAGTSPRYVATELTA